MSKFFRCSNVAIQSLKHCQHSMKRFHRRPCHVSKSFRLFSTTSNLIENADEYFNDALVSQLHEKKARHDELQVLVSQSADTATPTVFKELGQLSELVINFEKYLQLKKQCQDLKNVVNDSNNTDNDFKRMAKEELNLVEEEIDQLASTILLQMIEKDDADERNAVLEVRAGTGGSEARIFAMDLVKMYQAYAQHVGWRFNILDVADAEHGGCREAVVDVIGKGVFGQLKLEAGVHRVQRVPVTETSGRIHTSTATVAVLPEASETEVNINASDLRIDLYRASGAGGQHVNTTDSAVRITHIPTGIVAAIQDERSQHKNKAKAMKVLRARVYEHQRQHDAASRAEQRSAAVGGGARSERMRTYNWAQDRVTDHRSGDSTSTRILTNGALLDDFVKNVRAWHDRQALLNLKNN